MPAWRTPPQWDKPNHTKRSARLGFGMLAAYGAGSMVAERGSAFWAPPPVATRRSNPLRVRETVRELYATRRNV
jgi:hypothetical protein